MSVWQVIIVMIYIVIALIVGVIIGKLDSPSEREGEKGE